MIRQLVRAGAIALLFGAAASCSSDSLGPPAFRLRFLTQPAAAVAGVAQTIEVELLGDDGLRQTSSRHVVTLMAGDGAALQWTARASGGVATFPDVVVTEAGERNLLQATSGGLIAVSLPFAIGAAEADGQRLTVVIDAPDAVSNTPYPVVFTFRDAFGNAVSGAEVALSSATSGVAFAPPGGVTNAAGEFASMLRAPPGSLSLRATVAGTTIDIASDLSVADACTPAPMAIPGVVSGTLTQGIGCIFSERATHIREFSRAATGGVTLDLRPNFAATFEIRSDPATETVSFITDDSSSVEWLLLPGTYRLLVGTSGGSGAYTLSATTGPGNTGENVKVLVTPGTYTGQSLTITDLFDGTWYNDLFYFADPRPCTITVRSTAFEPYLDVINALTGDPVGAGTPSADGTESTAQRPQGCRSVGQPIVVFVSSVFGAEVGPYTLTVTINAAEPIGAMPATSQTPATVVRPSELRALIQRAAAARGR